MKKIQTLIDKKGNDVHSVAPGDTVYRAIELMADKNIGSVLVMEGGKPVGIFTERNCVRDVILQGKPSPNTPIRDVMSSPVICVGPEHSVDECMALMTDRRIRHLPVIQNGALVGLISIGDLVKSVIEDQQYTIDQLILYIQG